jgi:hypothetical protein
MIKETFKELKNECMTNYVTNRLGIFGSEFDERLNLTLNLNLA